jgi:autotransporter-associated beta strand protein
MSTKRGFADVGASFEYLQATNASWYYTWGLGEANRGSYDATHVPMFWGTWAVNQNNINAVRNNPNVDWVFGFNEPERPDQANVSVADAVSAWTTLSNGFAGSDVRLVSPAVSDTTDGRAWMTDFRNQVNAAGLTVDAVAFHWYGWSTPNNPAQAASNFIGSVNWYHNLWNRPVFITEFAIHDWGGNYTDAQISEANRQFLDIVVPWLENTSYVAGYSWYNWFSDASLFAGSPATPTPMAYEHTGVIESGETYNFAGIDHAQRVAWMAGGTLTHGNGASGTLRNIGAISGTNTITGTVDWDLASGGWVRVESGAVLQKTGLNHIDLGSAPVTNLGTININDGTLRVGGNVTGDGGTIVIAPGGNNSVARLELAGGRRVANNIGFRGRHTGTPAVVNVDGNNNLAGTLTVEVGGGYYLLRSDAGTLTLSGSATQALGIAITTGTSLGSRLVTLDGAGDGLVTGSIQNASGTSLAIGKTGTGTWTLAATNTYAGPTTVSQGRLVVDGTTGFGTTTVLGGASLGGNGLVRSDLVAQAAATIVVGGDGFATTLPATLIDNFDSYDNSVVQNVGSHVGGDVTGGRWQGVFNGTGNALVVDDSATDNSLRVWGVPGQGANGWRGAVTNLADNHPIDVSLADGETATYFFQLMNEGNAFADTMIGLTSATGTVDIANAWQDYAVMPYVAGGPDGASLRVFGSNIGDQTVMPIVDGQWYNVWLVVDNGSKTFDIYTSTGNEAGTLRRAGIEFGRITDAVDLDAFALTGRENGRVRIDNLYRFDGENVTNPFVPIIGSGETLTVAGDLTLSGGTIAIDIGATGHDRLVVEGTANLNGLLAVSLYDGFVPALGDTFVVLSAANIVGQLSLGGADGARFSLAASTASELILTATSGIAGDYNNDGTVDAADYTVWRDSLGAAAGSLLNDSLGTPIGVAQYETWRANFGTSLASLALDAPAAVPEPTALVAAGLLLILAAVRTRRCCRERTALNGEHAQPCH